MMFLQRTVPTLVTFALLALFGAVFASHRNGWSIPTRAMLQAELHDMLYVRSTILYRAALALLFIEGFLAPLVCAVVFPHATTDLFALAQMFGGWTVAVMCICDVVVMVQRRRHNGVG